MVTNTNLWQIFFITLSIYFARNWSKSFWIPPPPHLRSDYGQKYLYISYGNRFQIQPSEIAPMLQTCQGRNSWIQPRIKLLILMQNKFFCTQSFDIFIVHVRKNKMNIMWNWIKVHQKQEEIENALVFIFFFSWYSFKYDWFNTSINSM